MNDEQYVKLDMRYGRNLSECDSFSYSRRAGYLWGRVYINGTEAGKFQARYVRDFMKIWKVAHKKKSR